MTTILIIAAALILFALLLVAIGLAIFATFRNLPFPKKQATSTSPYHPYEKEVLAEQEWFLSMQPKEVEVVSYDGLALHARFLPAPGATKAILLMHGFRCAVAERDFAALLRFYYEHGISILLPDQRAHGKSGGKRICFGVKERFDCITWLEWLNSYAKPEHVFLGGVSMGAATVLMATRLNLPTNLRCVIADCGYTSPWDICAHVLKLWFHLPSFPFLLIADRMIKPLSGFHLKDASAWEAMQTDQYVPVLFIHGEKDALVPIGMSERNHEACAAKKRFLRVPDAKHGLSAWVQPERIQSEILKFIEECSGMDEPTQAVYPNAYE